MQKKEFHLVTHLLCPYVMGSLSHLGVQIH